MSEYFPEPESSGWRVKVELDLSNYATKADLKSPTGIDTSGLAKKMYESGTTTLIISNEEINDIMKIIKSIEESGVLIKVS